MRERDHPQPGPARPATAALLRSTTAGVLLILALEVAVFSLLSPTFLTRENVRDTLLSMSFIGLLALGQSVVILSGGIDLSVGSLLSLCNVVAAVLLSPDFTPSPWPRALAKGLIMIRVEPHLVHIATGAVIVAAVSLDRLRRRG